MEAIFICVVLPVAIVAIIYGAQINNDNKRTKIIIKALENNNPIDTDKLADALKKPRKTAREILNLRLLRACIFSFLGLAFCCLGIIIYKTENISFSDEPVSVPLFLGGGLLAVGLSYLVVYLVTRKQPND